MTSDGGAELSEAWRRILSLRSVADKIAIAIDCRLADVEALPTVARMVKSDIIIWIDRATLPMFALYGSGHVQFGIACDIYQLTEAGIALCDANGIERH